MAEAFMSKSFKLFLPDGITSIGVMLVKNKVSLCHAVDTFKLDWTLFVLNWSLILALISLVKTSHCATE